MDKVRGANDTKTSFMKAEKILNTSFYSNSSKRQSLQVKRLSWDKNEHAGLESKILSVQLLNQVDSSLKIEGQ